MEWVREIKTLAVTESSVWVSRRGPFYGLILVILHCALYLTLRLGHWHLTRLRADAGAQICFIWPELCFEKRNIPAFGQAHILKFTIIPVHFILFFVALLFLFFIFYFVSKLLKPFELAIPGLGLQQSVSPYLSLPQPVKAGNCEAH